MKLHYSFLSLLILLSTFGAFAQDIVVDGKLTREALFDPKISSLQLATAIQEAGLDVRTAVADAVRMKPGMNFRKVGEVGYFNLVPKAYGVPHAIVYYIPKSIKENLYGKTSDVAPVLMIMHGGGESTSGGGKPVSAYNRAWDSAQEYLVDFIPFAERTNTILIAPSTSFGWNSYSSSFMMRELIGLARKELNVSGDRIYVFGHSMGAMGLTRSSTNMADVFAGSLANSGGMVAGIRTEANLRPYLNINFTHINGTYDMFTSFMIDLKATDLALKGLALKENQPLNYKALEVERGHVFDLKIVEQEIGLLMKSSRNLYQSKLFAYMERTYNPDWTVNRIKDNSFRDYFWAKAKEMTDPEENKKSVGSHWNFTIDKGTNTIEMKNVINKEGLKEVTLYLSSQLLDLQQIIKVMANGQLIFEKEVKPSATRMIEIVREKDDPQFLFENSIDVSLSPLT